MVTIHNLSVEIKHQTLLYSISCRLLSGKITTILGKSGAGKTTFLKTLAGLIPFSKGTIAMDKQERPKLNTMQQAEEIGYVFQNFNLFPHLTILENCMDPLLVRGLNPTRAEKKAHAIIQELDIQDITDKYPAEISCGQKQRVAIGRALCLQPKVLLLDEPTASLDPFNTDNLVVILRKLTTQGLTVGISTQDVYLMNKIFDRVYYLENGTMVEFCDDHQRLSSCPRITEFIKFTEETI